MEDELLAMPPREGGRRGGRSRQCQTGPPPPCSRGTSFAEFAHATRPRGRCVHDRIAHAGAGNLRCPFREDSDYGFEPEARIEGT